MFPRALFFLPTLALSCTAFLDASQGERLWGDGDSSQSGGDGDDSSHAPPVASGGFSVGGSSAGGHASTDLPTGGSSQGDSGGQATGGSPAPSGGASGSGGSSPVDTGPPCKRGIAFDRWTEGPALSDLDALSQSVSWFYNWHYTVNPEFAGGYLSRGYEYVPMVWNGDFNQNTVDSAIQADTRALLGFNEPNIVGNGGTNMSVELVASLWPAVQAIAQKHNLKLVSPAVTYTNIPGGLNGPEFLRRMLELCPSCRFDAIAMHTYTCEARWVRDHLEPYREFGLPIWVTEFACMSNDTNLVRTFMSDTVEMLENDPDVERYAWFMSRAGNTSLLGAHGQLTPLGQLYLNLPEAKPCN
jgi:hypothetical protein